jgi:predicted house-cleaning noncanonical NTP pyrophosphatase (MazG superfamily)
MLSSNDSDDIFNFNSSVFSNADYFKSVKNNLRESILDYTGDERLTKQLSEDIKEILYEEYQAYLANTNRVLDTIKVLFAEDLIDQEEDESGVTVF